jgi:hypothetical protein
MRVTAVALMMSMLAPPETADEGRARPKPAADSAQPESTADPAEPAADPAEPEPDPAEPDSASPAEPEPEPEPEPAGPSVDELVAEARSRAAVGKHAEAIELYKQAYQLAPGDHGIAYAIAESAQDSGRCTMMRQYLQHFVQYADPNVYPNKINKASRALQSDSCTMRVPTEIQDAVSAGAPPTLVTASPGDGLVGGGVALVGVGLVALGAGIALVALGFAGQKSAVGQLEVPDQKYRNFIIGGAIMGPVGVAFIAGGAVMIARGNQPSYAMITPTGLTLRF